MKRKFYRIVFFFALTLLVAKVQRQTVGNLILENIPPIPDDLRQELDPYLDSRYASFRGWIPPDKGILIRTRLGNVSQLHFVEYPKAYRKQLTFSPEPLSVAAVCPAHSVPYFLYAVDSAGNERDQIYAFNYQTNTSALLTDGKARHRSIVWSNRGDCFAFASTMRNDKDFDVYIGTLQGTSSFQCLVQQDGYWSAIEFSPDDTKLLLKHYVSSNQSYLYIYDRATRKLTAVNPVSDTISYWSAAWAKDGKSIFYVSDESSDFHQLTRYDIATTRTQVLTKSIPWDIHEIEVSPSGDTIALVANEEGIDQLYFLNLHSNTLSRAQLPRGSLYGLAYKPDGTELGLVLNTPRSPSDVYSLNLARNTFIRWTYSEIGSIDTAGFSIPELFRYPTFDSVAGAPRTIPAYMYTPQHGTPPFPVLITIHGGPSGQHTPVFSPLIQFLVKELGIAVIAPNVRGSTGYGKEFNALDDLYDREHAVKDIGALLDWIATQPHLDDSRVCVSGGSYGGYMVLAALVHYSDRLACGIDVVGISNFVTFLENTGTYRQDLRRSEYGDEQEPDMRRFLESISPLTNAHKIGKPLLVVQGLHDPRVPVTEAEQIVNAVRANGVEVWYLLAEDEGHGFAKKTNRDFYQYVKILFLKKHLLQ
jgi:dipeptidyl aminopeptidase/acylaminoacyl peptidase